MRDTASKFTESFCLGPFQSHLSAMEEIIYDFIRLEDDIIDDLCRDVPVSNNFERFTVANSVGFEKGKLKVLFAQRSQNIKKNVDNTDLPAENGQQGFSTVSEEACKLDNSIDLHQKDFTESEAYVTAIDNETNTDCFSDVSKFPGNQENKRRYSSRRQSNSFHVDRRKSAVLCEELSKRGSCRDFLLTLEPMEVERVKLDLMDVVITNSEICENEMQELSHNASENSPRDMKIKIEMVQDIDIPFREDGEVDQAKLEDLGAEKSRTTRIKCRVPKDIIEENNKEIFSKHLISYLSKRLSSGASLNEGEMFNLAINEINT